MVNHLLKQNLLQITQNNVIFSVDLYYKIKLQYNAAYIRTDAMLYWLLLFVF